MEKKETSIEELKEYAKGILVELPEFGEGQPFTARVRKLSLMSLAAAGKIPNNLLSVVKELLGEGGGEEKNIDIISKTRESSQFYDFICNQVLVSPKLSELQTLGLELTDEQKMFLVSFAQGEVRSLSDFRQKQKNIKSRVNVAALQGKTVKHTKHKR